MDITARGNAEPFGFDCVTPGTLYSDLLIFWEIIRCFNEVVLGAWYYLALENLGKSKRYFVILRLF